MPSRAADASASESVNGASSSSFVAKLVTQMRSVGSFAATNAWAATTASASGAPRIEREWSTARQMLRDSPRFFASTPAAGFPPSVS